VAYIVFAVASRWVQDRWLIVWSLIISIVGQLLAINWNKLGWAPGFVLALLPWSYRTRFVVGYMIMNAGFMMCRPVTIALYSKLIGSQYQGKYLGWMVAGGSAARTMGPFVAVGLYYRIQGQGVNLLMIFGVVALSHAGCLALVVVLWSQLLPSVIVSKSINATASGGKSPLREELIVHRAGELA